MSTGSGWSRRDFLRTAGAGVLGAACASGAAAGNPDTRPNVLFISIDDLNDWVGCLGGHPQANTPNLDRLAGEGVLFENAHCQAPICTPSRGSLLSGMLPSTTGLYFLAPQYREAETLRDSVSLPQYFREHGYLSLGVGKTFHTGTDPLSFDEYGGEMGSFGPRPEKKLSLPKGHPLWDWGAFPERDEEMPDHKIALWAKDKLAQPHDRPFFLSVGFYRPHVPMYAPQKWFDLHPRGGIILPEASPDDLADIPPFALDLTYGAAAPRHEYVVSLNEWDHAVQSYLACTSFVDHCVGIVLDALRDSGHADNTLVVLWGDHGFHLGEKMRWEKRSLWEEATRAPLMLAGPGVRRGGRCRRPVGMIDLYPTLAELCGLPPKAGLDGQSLRPLVEDPDTPWERPALTTFGPDNHSLRSERYRYTRYADGSEELYDHDNDPNEGTNLAGKAGSADIIAEMRPWLPKVNRAPLPGSKGSNSPLYESPEVW
ncbi:MAG: sulfatase [Candidatus Hydrogenedentes bacterium]|nr:sulfatase [Candidatus Hydrogenedentota bacterium]